MNGECLSGDLSETRIFDKECPPLWDRKLTVVLRYMRTTESICCRNHMNITHITAGSGFWMYVDWNCFAHLSECYIPLKTCSLSKPYRHH
jgi:hypothetical protein